ncbi:sulfatase, partial [Thermodesulfobacteriota bacterium]
MKGKLGLVLFILSLCMLSNCNSNIDTQKNVPNIIMITLDTVRADHLGCYGYERDITKNIDLIAEDSVQFEGAISVIPLTGPSHVSIMTGLHPLTHQIYSNGSKVDEELNMVAEILKKNGYKTGAFVSSSLMRGEKGFGQGFDVYSNVARSKKGFRANPKANMRSADKTVDAAVKWLGGVDQEQFFLWLHFYDAHTPYLPPDEIGLKLNPEYLNYKKEVKQQFIKRFAKKRGLVKNRKNMPGVPAEALDEEPHVSAPKKPIALNSKQPRNSRRKFPHMTKRIGSPDNESLKTRKKKRQGRFEAKIDAYDGEIAFIDHQLARIFNFLKNKGLYENSIIIIMSDHGEMLGEKKNYFGHHLFLYRGALNIPLLMKFPGVTPRDIRTRLTNLDVFPTLLDALQIEYNDKMDGISYWPLIKSGQEVNPHEYDILVTHVDFRRRSARKKSKSIKGKDQSRTENETDTGFSLNEAFNRKGIIKDNWKMVEVYNRRDNAT